MAAENSLVLSNVLKIIYMCIIIVLQEEELSKRLLLLFQRERERNRMKFTHRKQRKEDKKIKG